MPKALREAMTGSKAASLFEVAALAEILPDDPVKEGAQLFLKNLPSRIWPWKKLLLVLIGSWLLLCAVAGIWIRSVVPGEIEMQSFREVQKFMNGPYAAGTELWTGAFYCGDKEGQSIFLSQAKIFGDTRMMIPAGSWDSNRRFAYTRDGKTWIKWREIEATQDAGKPASR